MESHQSKTGADDRARTGDINLGKVALYQLSYVRLIRSIFIAVRRQTSMRDFVLPRLQSPSRGDYSRFPWTRNRSRELRMDWLVVGY